MQIKNTILISSKELKFVKFDGTTNPCLHACICYDEASLTTLDEELHAKLFPLSLKWEASEWFSKFPYARITNFT